MRVASSILGACAISGCADETLDPAPLPATHYEVVHGWPQVPPGFILGQASGVGIEANGDVLVFRRAERDWFGEPLSTEPIASATIMRFDAAGGALGASFGAGVFAMPHGLTVAPNGHLWVTDVALQQVFELDAAGNILRTFGERGVSGDDASHFYMPTDVAVADDGTFFVSDGYGNARVVKFDAKGVYLGEWGSHGSGPGQFSVPHGIALGPDGHVYVADRGNARVQIFDTDGNLLGIWQSAELGRPWSLAFDDVGHAFVADGGDQPAMPPDRARILELAPDGSILDAFGAYGNQDGQMISPHDIAVGHDGSVYVVEVGIGRRAQKFALVPSSAR